MATKLGSNVIEREVEDPHYGTLIVAVTPYGIAIRRKRKQDGWRLLRYTELVLHAKGPLRFKIPDANVGE